MNPYSKSNSRGLWNRRFLPRWGESVPSSRVESNVQSIWFPEASSDPIETLEGEGIVDQTIMPYSKGRVYYRGSWWPATCTEEAPLLINQVVRVLARQNITLFVTAITSPLERQY